MSVQYVYRSMYSIGKLQLLKEHYQKLFEFLQKQTETWNRFCLDYERHIFFYPYELCTEMTGYCSEILALFGQSSTAISSQILDLGVKIIQIQNNNYKWLGYTANIHLKNGGFSLENLKKLYEEWETDHQRNERGQEISYSVIEVPSFCENDYHNDFLDLFRIDGHFLAEGYHNAHDMLVHDVQYCTVERSESPDAASIRDETIQIPWRASHAEERRQYVYYQDYVRTRFYKTSEQRNPSLCSSPMSMSSSSSESYSADDEEEIPYVTLEEGHFDAFDDYMRYEYNQTISGLESLSISNTNSSFDNESSSDI